jgi:MscS family membrane protein
MDSIEFTQQIIDRIWAWKWPVFLLALIASGLVNKIFLAQGLKFLRQKFLSKHLSLDVLESRIYVVPSYLLTTSIGLFYATNFLQAQATWIKNLSAILTFLIAGSLFWLAFVVLHIVTLYFEQLAAKTENKFDDLLVPLLSKTAKIILACLAFLYIAQSLKVDVTNILAGLGIGGLAFALAAKDTLSNFFGSLMIVIDRPFQIGDWIVVNKEWEGTVVKVGFRSTRIRTFYDSVISIPNSQLSTQEVDNLGNRRYRRMKTYLGVQYDTEPEQIEAFCEGIRTLISKHPYTRKDYFHVYLNRFSDSSLDILLYVFFEVPEWSNELLEKHRLMIDIIRLAKELDVQFAFPSSTLYFNRPDKKEKTIPDAKTLIERGEESGEKIVGQAITVKSPRSQVTREGKLPPRDF